MSIVVSRAFDWRQHGPWRATNRCGRSPTEKSHWIHMWPTGGPHVFTCGPHVLFQFHTFTHIWWKSVTCVTHVRSGKHMWIPCVTHVTHLNPHVATCEDHVGFYLLVSLSYVNKSCEFGTTYEMHMSILCDFSVRVCMALILRYLQDDNWRFCSETPKLVSVREHLRQPVDLYNPVFIYGAHGRSIVTCMPYIILEIIKRCVMSASLNNVINNNRNTYIHNNHNT